MIKEQAQWISGILEEWVKCSIISMTSWLQYPLNPLIQFSIAGNVLFALSKAICWRSDD